MKLITKLGATAVAAALTLGLSLPTAANASEVPTTSASASTADAYTFVGSDGISRGIAEDATAGSLTFDLAPGDAISVTNDGLRVSIQNSSGTDIFGLDFVPDGSASPTTRFAVDGTTVSLAPAPETGNSTQVCSPGPGGTVLMWFGSQLVCIPAGFAAPVVGTIACEALVVGLNAWLASGHSCGH